MKDLKITPPKGYVIDEANSTFECIKFKPKQLTYEDIEATLLKNNFSSITCKIKATSMMQLEKLLAINKLMNVAKYLNGDWKPNWDNHKELKHHIYIGENPNVINTAIHTKCSSGVVYFLTDELARQAIDILGEETIRLALSTDW